MDDGIDGRTFLAVMTWVGLASFIIYGAVTAAINDYAAGFLLLAAALAVGVVTQKLPLKALLMRSSAGSIEAKWEEARQDLFASQVAVRELGEELGELAMWTATSVGRFAPTDLTEQLGVKRDKVERLLTNLGSGPARKQEIRAAFNHTIVRDLQGKIPREASKLIKEKVGNVPAAEADLSRQLSDILRHPDRPTAAGDLETFLSMQTLHSPRLRNLSTLWSSSVPVTLPPVREDLDD
ncbi:MAG TPA: hypothetical protein VM327_02980 [Candidatus Thermoplasmatota archaeon]|nr:hypothetical protein [Candidatus Thermoplasmatota archaeon]